MGEYDFSLRFDISGVTCTPAQCVELLAEAGQADGQDDDAAGDQTDDVGQQVQGVGAAQHHAAEDLEEVSDGEHAADEIQRHTLLVSQSSELAQQQYDPPWQSAHQSSRRLRVSHGAHCSRFTLLSKLLARACRL